MIMIYDYSLNHSTLVGTCMPIDQVIYIL